MKLTLADIKTPISKVLSLASTDSRVVDYINEAQERLLHKGKWPGTFAKFQITSSDGSISWPRQLETIERVAVNSVPGAVRNSWYEFLESGPGLLKSTDDAGVQLIDRGEAPIFSDISSTGGAKKLRLYTSVTIDATPTPKVVLVQGYDQNSEWIRSQDSGSGNWFDGEKLTLTTTYVESVNQFTQITGVQKPVTQGNLKLYEYNTSDSSSTKIAEYEPLETNPSYRRSVIPGLKDSTVTVIGKLRYLPVVNDADYLVITSMPAIKLMTMAIRKEENNLLQEAVGYEAMAVKTLNEQLAQFLGDGVTHQLRVAGVEAWGGAVDNMQ